MKLTLITGKPLAFGGLDSDAGFNLQSFAVVTINNSMQCTDTSSEGLDSVEIWNPEEESWEEVEGLESRRAGFAGAIVTLPC